MTRRPAGTSRERLARDRCERRVGGVLEVVEHHHAVRRQPGEQHAEPPVREGRDVARGLRRQSRQRLTPAQPDARGGVREK